MGETATGAPSVPETPPQMSASVVYLNKLQSNYDSLRTAADQMQAKAVADARDLGPEELRTIGEMVEQGKAIQAQMRPLAEAIQRDAEIQQMRGRLDLAVWQATQVTAPTGNGAGQPTNLATGRPAAQQGGAQTQDRDPGHYRQGGTHSYFGDHYAASRGNNREAAERLTAHANALRDNEHLRDVLGAGGTTLGLGLVPPVWLAELFAPILHRRLRLASQVRQLPWPGSPMPWSIPIAGTAASGTTVAEGVNPSQVDPSYTVLTVTPKAQEGFTQVSRQMLEGSNPAVDAVIWADLIGNFFDNCETQFITDLTALAGVNTITISAGALTTTDVVTQRNGLLDAIATISDSNAGDADVFCGRTSRWTTYLKFTDGNQRPMILAQQYPAFNPTGRGDLSVAYANPVQGTLEHLSVVTSPTVAASTGFVINSQELMFSYSPPMQFLFEQPVGPALLRIGVFGYMANVVGRRPKAITKITYSGS